MRTHALFEVVEADAGAEALLIKAALHVLPEVLEDGGVDLRHLPPPLCT